MATKKKGVSPAQAQRDSVTSAVRARGKKVSNIWLVWSAINKADYVIAGDLRADHFFCCEGDPRIIAVDHNPKPIPFGTGDVIEHLEFDALVTLCDNTREWRLIRPHRRNAEVLRYAAEKAGATLVDVSPSYMEPFSMRISNWRVALATLLRCRGRPIAHLEDAIAMFLTRQQKASIDEVLQHFSPGGDPPLLTAAIVSLLSRRKIKSDLDFRNFSLHTMLSMKEGV